MPPQPSSSTRSQRFFQFQHVDAGLEFLAGAHRVDVVIELLDTATLELTVQETEQTGVSSILLLILLLHLEC